MAAAPRSACARDFYVFRPSNHSFPMHSFDPFHPESLTAEVGRYMATFLQIYGFNPLPPPLLPADP